MRFTAAEAEGGGVRHSFCTEVHLPSPPRGKARNCSCAELLFAAIKVRPSAPTSSPKVSQIKQKWTAGLRWEFDSAQNGLTLTWAQYLLGFALETNNAEENAKKKIISKNLDAIVLNSLKEKGAGFGVDTNKISIIDSDNKITRFELKSKADVASDIVDFIITRTSK